MMLAILVRELRNIKEGKKEGEKRKNSNKIGGINEKERKQEKHMVNCCASNKQDL